MKHLNLELEKLEQRIAPGGFGLFGLCHSGSADGSKDDGSKGGSDNDGGSKGDTTAKGGSSSGSD